MTDIVTRDFIERLKRTELWNKLRHYFPSPELTVEQLVKALERGNVETYLGIFDYRVRTLLREVLDQYIKYIHDTISNILTQGLQQEPNRNKTEEKNKNNEKQEGLTASELALGAGYGAGLGLAMIGEPLLGGALMIASAGASALLRTLEKSGIQDLEKELQQLAQQYKISIHTVKTLYDVVKKMMEESGRGKKILAKLAPAALAKQVIEKLKTLIPLIKEAAHRASLEAEKYGQDPYDLYRQNLKHILTSILRREPNKADLNIIYITTINILEKWIKKLETKRKEREKIHA